MDFKVTCLIMMVAVVRVSLNGVSPPNRCACFRNPRIPVNECENSTLNDCDPDATCFDLSFGFACTCNEGFIGNGTTCVGECAGDPCQGENRTCYRDQACVCTPGFHELNDTCVQECDVYGDTYIDYPGSALVCFVAPLNITSAATVDACKALCTATSGCISILYSMNDTTCGILPCDPLPPPPSIFTFLGSGVITSVRNCA